MINSIGEALRRERVRQGLDLQTISQDTKIGTRLLRAIEDGDFSKLPGGVFTRSFIRQYARALGMDSAALNSEIDGLQLDTVEAAAPAPRAVYSDPAASSRSGWVSVAWIVLAGAGCAGVYYYMRPTEPANPPPVTAQAPPRETASPKRAAATPDAGPATAASSAPGGPLGSGSLQVVLSASEASWVSISVDGKLKFSGILQPNDRREINAEEKVKVVAGNAGGIDILLNGKNIEALGPKGQVRTVELTRAGAQVVSRAPKPAPLL